MKKLRSQPDATFDKTPRRSIQSTRNREINTQTYGRIDRPGSSAGPAHGSPGAQSVGYR